VRVVSTPIAGAGLTRMGVDRSNVSPWFEAVPKNAAEWKDRAALIRKNLLGDDWLDALRPAFDAKGPAAERLERASKLGFAVTAGQQPGLFGGPLYTWWKALTALSLADRLERETGLPVVPVFWAASDDSDYTEAAETFIATATGAERLALPPLEDSGRALARIPVGDVSAQIEKLLASAGSGSNSSVADIVRNAYRADATIGGAYLELLRSVLNPLGIAVLDAAHPAVRSAAFPVLKQALEISQKIEDSLLARSAEIKEKKLSTQVKVVKGRTLVFGDADGQRDRILIRDARDKAVTAKAGDLGPNVLLRPIVERSILPTVCYIGGPAEIAYFAQVTAVADAMETPAPVIVPRWSGVVIEPRIEKILARYDVALEDLRDPHAVETRMARESLPPQLTERLAALRQSLDSSVHALSSAPGADLVAPTVLDGLVRNMTHRLDRLERRYVAAVKRRGNEALREVAIARGSLFPADAPQERALNGVPLLARYGDELIESALREIAQHTSQL
jgi:bacillithiol biosynthesis cysteine-adding enzyme BshC